MAEIRYGNYSSCCRLCLSEKINILKNVFSETINKDGLVQKISSSLGVQISPTDKLSILICDQCLLKVNSWNSYRNICLDNQSKLDRWLTTWNENISNSSFLVKDEPVDEDATQNNADVLEMSNGVDHRPQIVKSEPAVEEEDHENEIDDIYDQPPPLTPHPPDNNEEDEEESHFTEEDVKPKSPRRRLIQNPKSLADRKKCTVCRQSFYNMTNRLRHERNVHGLDVDTSFPTGETSNTGGETTPSTELATINNGTKDAADNSSEKIQFAAGLCLQSKSSPPKQLPESPLTKIEENYLLKCKIMITIFNSLTCSCHNLKFAELKRLISHMRQTSCWFPGFTCYNCQITWAGRSGKMKHVAQCTRLKMENLIRLSELRGRDDNKIRLYQNYRCTQCKVLFAFFEDFCDHVYYDHLPEGEPYLCLCNQSYTDLEEFKTHAFNTCYVAYYCDICFIEIESREEFREHCVEMHDHEKNFDFFQVDKSYYVLSNIEIANLLLSSRSEASVKAAELTEIIPVVEEIRAEPVVIKETVAAAAAAAAPPPPPPVGVITKTEKRDGDAAWQKQPVQCISCPNIYSSYHNMIRHLKTSHKFTTVMMQNSLMCPDCGDTLENLNILVKHRKSHSDSNSFNDCLTCKAKFNTNLELRNHIAKDHSALLAAFAQEDGSIVETGLPLKRKRSQSVANSTTCEECGESFNTLAQLESHRNTHLNIKLYRDSKTHSYRSSKSNLVCKLCRKTFTSRSELKEHMELHSQMPSLHAEDESEVSVKQVICTICNKAFAKAASLLEHIKKKHPEVTTPLGVERYPRQCCHCDKWLSTGGAYANHMLMHERILEDVVRRNKMSNEEILETPLDLDLPVMVVKSGAKLGVKSGSARSVASSRGCYNNKDEDTDYHTCKKCFKIFANRYTLKNHMKCHGITMKSPTRTSIKGVNKNTKVYWCDLCHQGCQGEAELQRHKLEHQSDETEDVIVAVAVENSKVVIEEEVVTGERKPQVFSCDVCTKYFSTKFALKKHKEKHLLEPHYKIKSTMFPCKYCKVSFDSVYSLNDHMNAEHNETTGPKTKKLKKNSDLYSCNICKKTFTTSGALQSHQGWHKRGKAGKHLKSEFRNIVNNLPPSAAAAAVLFQCKLCSASFPNDTSLQIHILETHRNVNATIIQPTVVPKCTTCNLTFDSLGAFEKHAVLHTIVEKQKEKKSCACQYCDKRFSRSDTLGLHMRQHHAEYLSSQSEYKCGICERVFDKQNALSIHLKMHEKMKSYQAVKAPPVAATGKLYSCSICQIGFTVPKDLRNHIISTHPF